MTIVYDYHCIPERLRASVEACAERFNTEFTTVYEFSRIVLEEATSRARQSFDNVHLPSKPWSTIDLNIATISRLANSSTGLSLEDRNAYLAAILQIYSFLDVKTAASNAALIIAPKREGTIIAQRLGLMNGPAQLLTPEAKRIHCHDGLLVGLQCPAIVRHGNCVVVDGAIASGATISALMHHLHSQVDAFFVYCAHATAQGLALLVQAGEKLGKPIEIHAGMVSGTLDEHFYARNDNSQNSPLVLGDIGDTIAPCAAEFLRALDLLE
jgi:hypothetical protein